MFTQVFATVIFTALLNVGYSQRAVGDLCTFQATEAEGVCKPIADCPQAITDLQQNGVIPQNCGFQGSAPIVCCKNQQQQLQPQQQERPPGQVSKEKCREYSKYVIEKVRPPILIPNAPLIERNACGHKVVKLIIGGKPAERREFPHMAVVGYEAGAQDIRWLCGGTIISDQYILTAAHCLVSAEFGPAKWIRTGVTNLTAKTKFKQDVAIAERIAYPTYKSRSHYDDIALLKLEQPLNLNSYARPACLNTFTEINAEKAIATGFGNTAYAGVSSEQLLKVTLDFFDHASCNQSYKNQISRRLEKGIIDETQLCAGSKTEEEKDTCQGDSGGPLQIYHITDDVKCMYDIIGVTSFGKACSGSPGVYTRVSHYVKWIEDIVWP